MVVREKQRGKNVVRLLANTFIELHLEFGCISALLVHIIGLIKGLVSEKGSVLPPGA